MKRILIALIIYSSAAVAQPTTVSQFKLKVDSTITNQSSPASIRPVHVGNRIKEAVDIATNPANMLQNSDYRFATDDDKQNWNGKAPAVNSVGGYQMIASRLQLSNNYANSQPLYTTLNNRITCVFKMDTAQSHISDSSGLFFMQSTDRGKTWTAPQLIYSSPTVGTEARSWGLYQDKITGVIYVPYGVYNTSPFSLIRLEYLKFDSLLTPIGSAVSINPPLDPVVIPGQSPGAFFGAAITGDDGLVLQGYYKQDSICFLKFDGIDFTPYVKYYTINSVEPYADNLGAGRYIIAERNQSAGIVDSARPRIKLATGWTIGNNAATAPVFKGYLPAPPRSSQVPVFVSYDKWRGNILALTGTRNDYTLGLGFGIRDSMMGYVMDTADIETNTWYKSAQKSREMYSGQSDYWYHHGVWLDSNTLFFGYSNRIGTGISTKPEEITNIYNGYINWVPDNGNGGIANIDMQGVNVTPSKYYNGIFDALSPRKDFDFIDKVPVTGTNFLVNDPSHVGFHAITSAEASTYLSPDLNTTVQKSNNISGLGLSYLTDTSTRNTMYPLTVWNTTTQTGVPTFQHPRVASAVYNYVTIFWRNVAGVNGRAFITFYTQSGSTVNSSINLTATILNATGAVPFDTIYATIGTGDLVSIMLGSNFSASWAAGYQWGIESWVIAGSNKGTIGNDSWTKNYTFQYATSLSSFPNTRAIPLVYNTPNTLSATATLDFPSTAANSVSDLTITLTGAVLGDNVVIGVPNGSTAAAGNYSAWVSATNTVKVRFSNNSSSTAYDPASGVFKATIIR